jgi:hypothetical protein
MIKIMSSIPTNLTDAKQVFPQNFRDEEEKLQSTLRSLKSAAKDNLAASQKSLLLKNTLESLNAAEEKLFPPQNNEQSYQVELSSIFNGVTKLNVQEKLDQILPVFQFLDTVSRINSKSTKILNTVESENETEKGTLKSEINKQAQSLMQKTYEVIEKLPTIIKSSVNNHNNKKDSNHSASITKSILSSTFYKLFINQKFANLNQKNPDKAKTIKEQYFYLQNLFSLSPTDSNLKNIFNFRYANMIAPSQTKNSELDPEKVFHYFIELSKKIDFDGIQANSTTLTRNPNKTIPEDLKEDLIAAHTHVLEIYKFYEQNKTIIHNVLLKNPDRILEMKDTTLAFMNQTSLDRILKRLSLNKQPEANSLIKSSKSKSLILTNLNLAIDKINNGVKYQRLAKQGISPFATSGSNGRKSSSLKGSKAGGG